jgi:hypothetical protein
LGVWLGVALGRPCKKFVFAARGGVDTVLPSLVLRDFTVSRFAVAPF